jgi:hypothetical protein
MSAVQTLKAFGPAHRVLILIYLLGSIVGVVATWYYNLRFEGDSYLGSWFANDAAASAAVDVIIVAFIATIWMFVESRRIGLRGAWLHALVVPTIAIAFSFPLFLARREYHLARPLADLHHWSV